LGPEGYQPASVRSGKDSFLPPASHCDHPRLNSYDDLRPTSLLPRHSYGTITSTPGTARCVPLFLDQFIHRTNFSIALLLRNVAVFGTGSDMKQTLPQVRCTMHVGAHALAAQSFAKLSKPRVYMGKIVERLLLIGDKVTLYRDMRKRPDHAFRFWHSASRPCISKQRLPSNFICCSTGLTAGPETLPSHCSNLS
jgi:hypothetical protein